MSTTTDLLIARNGGKYTDASLTGLTAANNYIYAVVNEDCVFTTITDNAGSNLITDWGIATKTITKGMIIAASDGNYITALTVSSGSVLLISG